MEGQGSRICEDCLQVPCGQCQEGCDWSDVGCINSNGRNGCSNTNEGHYPVFCTTDAVASVPHLIVSLLFGIAVLTMWFFVVCRRSRHGQTTKADLTAIFILSAVLLVNLCFAGVLAGEYVGVYTSEAGMDFWFPLALRFVAIATPIVTIFMSAVWLIHNTRQHLQSLKLCLWQFRACVWFTRGTHDPVSKGVAEMLDQRRLERFMVAAKASCWVGIPAMLYISHYWLSMVVEENELRTIDTPDNWLRKMFPETVAAVFYIGFMISCDMSPSIVSNRSMNLANVLLHSMWVCRHIMMIRTDGAQWASDYDFNKYWILAARVFQGLIFGNAQLSVVLSGWVVAVDLFIVTNLSSRDQLQNYIWREVAVFLVMSVVLWTVQQIQLAEAKALVSVEAMDAAATLVQGLLACTCDVVVKLDHELRLMEPSPALSALLLRDGPLARGLQLTDLLLPEDGERFRTCLSAPSVSRLGEEGQGSNRTFAGLCHVKLRHRLVTALPVNLFFSSLERAGQVSYLVGIQESREELERQHDVPDAAVGPWDFALHGTAVAQDRLSALPEDSIKLMTQRSLSSFSGSDGGDEADMHVWVNADSPALTVLNCSRGCAMLAGPRDPPCALSDWLSSSDLDKLMHAVRQPDRGSAHVRFRPGHASWSYKCKLSVDVARQTRAAPPASMPVCLVVERAVCTISKPKGRDRKPAAMHDLEVWVSLSDDGQLCITNARGCSQQLVNALRESDLRSWVQPVQDFNRALLPVLNAVLNEEPHDMPCTLGTFTFRSPDRCPSPINFKATLTWVDEGNPKGDDPLWHFILSMCS